MPEQISSFLSRASSIHVSILMLLGIALFGGTVGGRLFEKIRMPQVMAYILVGIALGQIGIGIVNTEVIDKLGPFNSFALGLIGFTIGGELKKTTLARYGMQFLSILLSEGLAAFLGVSVLTTILGFLLLRNWPVALTLGLVLGAVASATAPAATTDVLWQYKTRGPLTATILGIVALDDGLSLLLFAVASAIGLSLVGGSAAGPLELVLRPLYEVAGSVALGVLSGLVLSRLLRRCSEEDRILAFSIGTVLLVLGLAVVLRIDVLLAAMTLGATIANYTPRKSKEVFRVVGKFAPPIYVLFFVMFGAKLNVSSLTLTMALLACAYLIGRSAGKMLGAHVGARMSNAPRSIQKYLPVCLFSQAGVAIGLSILAGSRFPGVIGNAVVGIITTTTFVVQLVGPPFTKWAVSKAGEVGLNVTEEDIIRTTTAAECMDKDVPLIGENESVSRILTKFGEGTNLYYPVVGASNRLMGIITIDNLRDTFTASGLQGLLVAHDLMEPAAAVIGPDTPLFEAKDLIDSYSLEYLPVVTKEDGVVGLLESRRIKRFVSRRILELQKQSESLG
jgi:Kef-type K+ transport system membrane component KefB